MANPLVVSIDGINPTGKIVGGPLNGWDSFSLQVTISGIPPWTPGNLFYVFLGYRISGYANQNPIAQNNRYTPPSGIMSETFPAAFPPGYSGPFSLYVQLATPNPDGTYTVIATSPDFAGNYPFGSTSSIPPNLSLDVNTELPGQGTNFFVTNFKSGATFDLNLLDKNNMTLIEKLGTFTAAQNGNYSGFVSYPTATPPGNYLVQAQDQNDSNNRTNTVDVTINVASGALPQMVTIHAEDSATKAPIQAVIFNQDRTGAIGPTGPDGNYSYSSSVGSHTVTTQVTGYPDQSFTINVSSSPTPQQFTFDLTTSGGSGGGGGTGGLSTESIEILLIVGIVIFLVLLALAYGR